jgi:hypothetical protein
MYVCKECGAIVNEPHRTPVGFVGRYAVKCEKGHFASKVRTFVGPFFVSLTVATAVTALLGMLRGWWGPFQGYGVGFGFAYSEPSVELWVERIVAFMMTGPFVLLGLASLKGGLMFRQSAPPVSMLANGALGMGIGLLVPSLPALIMALRGTH